MVEEDMAVIAEAMDLVISDKANLGEAQRLVKTLTDKYPIYEGSDPEDD